MQAMRLSSRCFNFCHLHRFARCSILNSNIDRKYWKIANFRNQQFSFSFCTFRPADQSQQNEATAKKQQAIEPDLLAHIGQAEKDKNASKGGKTIQVKKLEYKVDVEPRNRLFTIELKQGVSGRKFIGINQKSLVDKIKLKNNNFYAHFASIPVPEDAYLLLNGMRALQIDLQEITANGIRQDKSSSLICRQMVKGGCFYDYKMEIHLREDQQPDFMMKTIKTDVKPTHKPRKLFGPIPIDVFLWLKDQMAEILTEYEKELDEIKKKDNEKEKDTTF